MNEQINQLYQQALEFAYKNVNKEIWNTDNFHAIVAGKFAELIVRECMKVAVYKDSGYMHPADVAGYMAAGRSTAASLIKEHFGVE